MRVDRAPIGSLIAADRSSRPSQAASKLTLDRAATGGHSRVAAIALESGAVATRAIDCSWSKLCATPDQVAEVEAAERDGVESIRRRRGSYLVRTAPSQGVSDRMMQLVKTFGGFHLMKKVVLAAVAAVAVTTASAQSYRMTTPIAPGRRRARQSRVLHRHADLSYGYPDPATVAEDLRQPGSVPRAAGVSAWHPDGEPGGNARITAEVWSGQPD